MSEDSKFRVPIELSAEIDRLPQERRSALRQVWDLAGQANPVGEPMIDVSDAWLEIVGQMPKAELNRAAAPDRVPAPRRRFRSMGLVAATVAVLTLSLFWWTRPVVVETTPGGHASVTLPDGSTVELNSASRLQYTRGFRSWPDLYDVVRTVRLDGEAFFEVAPLSQTFVVETFNARVRVFGTRFNVRARSGKWEAETSVTLASGHVRVEETRSLAGQSAGFDLKQAGEAVTIAPAHSGPSPPRPLAKTLAWRQDGFVAVDQPLGAVLSELERRYAVELDAANGLALADPLSLFYSRAVSIESILQDICLASDCLYRKTSRGFVLYPALPDR